MEIKFRKQPFFFTESLNFTGDIQARKETIKEKQQEKRAHF